MIKSRDGDYVYCLFQGRNMLKFHWYIKICHFGKACKALRFCKMFGKMHKSQVFDCVCVTSNLLVVSHVFIGRFLPGTEMNRRRYLG